MPPSPAPHPQSWRRWSAGFAIICLGWLASPSAVPVYDGVQTPDEPYKYVGKTPAPAAASVTRRAGQDVKLQSSESGPQVLLDLGEGAFSTTANDLTVTASPLLPDGAPPRGTFDGNAYRITVTAPARLVPEKTQGFLFLRAAVMTSPDPVIVHRDRPQDPWVEQRTSRVGRDNLSTPFRAMGDYAVIRLPGAKPIDSLSSSTGKWLQIGGVVVAALVLGALIIRSRREPS
jgi:hypothetical protein